MEDLIAFIAKGLVSDPDAVSVKRTEQEDEDRYELEVDSEDVGKIIGRQGRTAKAIRAVVGAAAAKQERRARVEIVD